MSSAVKVYHSSSAIGFPDMLGTSTCHEGQAMRLMPIPETVLHTFHAQCMNSVIWVKELALTYTVYMWMLSTPKAAL